jgi:nicotinamide mononucleotide (NMN) deamidase PncC
LKKRSLRKVPLSSSCLEIGAARQKPVVMDREAQLTQAGIGEAGAAGPPNPYGDPAGHCWLAVAGPTESTRHLLTGVDEREPNMVAFAAAALTLFLDTLNT